MERPRRRLRWILGLLAALASLLACHGEAPRTRADELARWAPRLDPGLIRHLTDDDDADWATYCRGLGAGPLSDAMAELRTCLQVDSYPEFVRRRETIGAAMLRIGRAFEVCYDFHAPSASTRLDLALPPRTAFAMRELDRRYMSIDTDPDLVPEERIRLADELAVRFREAGDPHRALFAAGAALRSERELGRKDRYRVRLDQLIRASRALGEDFMLCQSLGSLGVLHWEDEDEDSMRVCFDEGLAIAARHAFADQIVRLTRFYASYDAGHGRLARALTRFQDAQRICDGSGDPIARLRLQVDHLEFLADRGCWDLVDRDLRRVPPLQRALPATPGAALAAVAYGFARDRLECRLAFATGDAARGDSLMRRLLRSVPPGAPGATTTRLLGQWATGLEQTGRTTEALTACRRALAHAATLADRADLAPLRLQEARLLVRGGHWAAAGRSLDSAATRARDGSVTDARLRRGIEVLRARLLAHDGRRAEARRRIERTFRAYRAYLRGVEGSSLSELESDDARQLRDAVHEIERFSPAEGYAFEMAWRSLGHEVGRHGRTRRPAPPDWPEAGMPHPPLDGPHLVYRFADDGLVRWTATPSGVVVDTLALAPGDALARVRGAVEALQTEVPPAGGGVGPLARERLRRLGAILLPRSLGAPGGAPRPIHVSPDGPLAALPFEALPTPGAADGRPLALSAEVDYVHGWAEPSARRAGPAVIVADPRVPQEIADRYGWTRGLPGTDLDVRVAHRRLPDARLLTGEHATKAAVRAHWPGAAVILLSAHHVRDHDDPRLGFVPLAVPAGAAGRDELLEIADIEGLDLSACRLAVLATCASGAPYRSAARSGPSLGDAFLDAGARSVVRSFWDVGDDETHAFVRAFFLAWTPERPATRALADARRALMESPGGVAPRVWASWSVQCLLPRRGGAAPARGD